MGKTILKNSTRGQASQTKWFIVAIVVIIIIGAGAYIAIRPGGPGRGGPGEFPGEFEAAFIQAVPKTDMAFGEAGFNAYKGLSEIDWESQYGHKITWNVAQDLEEADIPTVTQSYATDPDVKIVATWGGEFAPIIRGVAPKVPDTYFLLGGFTGLENVPPNAVWMDPNLFLGDYLEGMVAGDILANHDEYNKHIGMIIGEEYPRQTKMVEAFKCGLSQVANIDEFTFDKVVLGSWGDTKGGRDAANTMMDSGADWIWTYADGGGQGALSAISKRPDEVAGVSQSMVDKRKYFPKPRQFTVAVNMQHIFEKMVRDLLEGNWEPGKGYEMTWGSFDPEPWPPEGSKLEGMLTQDTIDLINEQISAMERGNYPQALKDWFAKKEEQGLWNPELLWK